MSREREILSYLIDIKEHLAKMDEKLTDYPEVKKQVQKNSNDILKAKTSVNTLRWLFGVVLLGAPTTLYAVMRIFKS